MMTGAGRRRRERLRRSRVRDVMLLEHLFDTRHVGAHERALRDHNRLVTIADVIREQRPFRRGPRLDDEDWFGTLRHDDYDPCIVEHEAVARAEDGATRERQAEFHTVRGTSFAVHVRTIFPPERDGVAPVCLARRRQLRRPIEPFNDSHISPSYF